MHYKHLNDPKNSEIILLSYRKTLDKLSIKTDIGWMAG